MNQIKAQNIVRSLMALNEFAQGKDTISSGKEFIEILIKSQALMILIGKERQTDFYVNRIKTYPQFHEIEIEEFIKNRRGEKQLYWAIGGWILAFFEWIYTIIRTKGNSETQIINKLNDMIALNLSFIATLEKPGLEELIH